MEKRKLAKLALAALVIASNAPTGIQASEEESKVNGILLAAHSCGSNGCGNHRKELSDNTSTSTNPYNTSTNSYQTGSYSGSGSNYGSSSYNNPANSSSYGTQSYGSGSYSNTPDRSSSSSEWNTDANRGASTEWRSNRTYGSTGVDTYNTDATRSNYSDTYTSPGASSAYGSTTTSSSVSDEDFRRQLSSDARTIFDSLNRTGKDLAKSLANDPSYRTNKDAAVKEAQRRAEGGSSTTTRTSGSMINR